MSSYSRAGSYRYSRGYSRGTGLSGSADAQMLGLAVQGGIHAARFIGKRIKAARQNVQEYKQPEQYGAGYAEPLAIRQFKKPAAPTTTPWQQQYAQAQIQNTRPGGQNIPGRARQVNQMRTRTAQRTSSGQIAWHPGQVAASPQAPPSRTTGRAIQPVNPRGWGLARPGNAAAASKPAARHVNGQQFEGNYKPPEVTPVDLTPYDYPRDN